jgi:serine/threonine protein kinase
VMFNLQEYTIVKFLASGAQGKTYLIRNSESNIYVIKFTLIDYDDISGKDQLLATKRVLTILSKIKHPNIVRIYEIGDVKVNSSDYQQVLDIFNWNEEQSQPEQSDSSFHFGFDIPYVIMEYINGYDMSNRDLEPDKVPHLLTDLVSALRVFQNHNIRHGDMNFQNVIYNIDTNNYVVIDFDFSRIINLPQEQLYTETDMYFVNINIVAGLSYLKRSTYTDEKYSSYYPMLPDTTLINKYCNYTIEATSLPINHYVSVFSILMGAKPVILTLEHGQKEEWQYGIKKI